MTEHSTGSHFCGMEILENGLRELCRNDTNVEKLIAPRQVQIITLLRRYIAFIEDKNRALGLVGTADREELIRRHILDSLAPLWLFSRLLRQRAYQDIPRIADVGSGAGLPGIPLAITMPQARFFLIERMGRRAEFLRGALKALELPNVTIVEDEMEKFAHNIIMKNPSRPERFDIVTFRAFRRLEPKIIKGLFRLCAADGVIAAYKGKREKIDAEIDELEKYSANHGAKSGPPPLKCEVIPCPAPLSEEDRHILLIRSGERQ